MVGTKPIKDEALVGATITYGVDTEGDDVIIGGDQSDFTLHWPEIDVSGSPTYDASGRRIENIEYEITLRCFLLTKGGNTQAQHDTRVVNLRNHLMKTAPTVKFPQGLGADLIPSDMRAVRPISLVMRPTGMNFAFYFEWKVSLLFAHDSFITLPSDLASGEYAFKSITWNVTHSLDSGGLATRTLTGEIAITGFSGKDDVNPIIYIQADWLRKTSVVFFLPDGFRRMAQNFNVSADKLKLTFQIVDQEFRGEVFPEGIEYADGSFQMNFVDPVAFSKAVASLQVNYRLAPGYLDSTVNARFFVDVAAAQKTIIDNLTPLLSPPEGEDKRKWAVIPVDFFIQRGLYDSSRDWSCRSAWMMVGCIRDLLWNSDFWTPIADKSPTDWSASMNAAGVNRPTGHGGWLSDIDDDVLGRHEPEIINSAIVGQETTIGFATSQESMYGYAAPVITKDTSWLHFDVDIKVIKDEKGVIHRKAIETVTTPDGGVTNPYPTEDDMFMNIGNTYEQEPESGPDPTINDHVRENKGFPKTYVQISYVGVRIKWAAFAPELKTLMGKNLTPIRLKTNQVGPKIIGSMMGEPVWLIKQVVLYSVDGKLDKIEPYRNTICEDYTEPEEYDPQAPEYPTSGDK